MNAVIHHFASVQRRELCLQEICRILKPGGTALVTAWAKKQPDKTYSEADQMIPWNVHPQFNKESPHFERFYHFFDEGEFASLSQNIPNFKLISDQWIKGNWHAIFQKE